MLSDFQFKKTRWLHIPVEVGVREFQSRLLLACLAAERGISSTIGNKDAITRNIEHLPQGIMFLKDIASNMQRDLERRVAAGMRLFSLDEEGLCAYNNSHVYLNNRLSHQTIALAEGLCFWGKTEYDIARSKYPEISEKSCISGNPRVDLWRPEIRGIFDQVAEQYRKQFGDYILYSSSFSLKHHKGESFAHKQAKEYGLLEDEEGRQRHERQLSRLKDTFDIVCRDLERLIQEFPNYQFLIRPHPGESPEHWQAMASKYANATVNGTGPISPWIRGSKLLLHSSCTTGLEAFFLAKPAISYVPFDDFEYAQHLSNRASIVVHNYDALKSKLSLLAADQTQFPWAEYQSNLSAEIASQTGRFATDKILDFLEAKPWAASEGSIPMKTRISEQLRPLRKRYLKIVGKEDKQYSYKQTKYSGQSFGQVREMFLNLGRTLGRFDRVKITEIAYQLYCVEPISPRPCSVEPLATPTPASPRTAASPAQ